MPLVTSTPDHRRPTTSVAGTFASFALPIAMLGVMWPEVRARFDQSLGTLGFVALVYGIGRMSTATTGRILIRRVGMQRAFLLALGALTIVTIVLATASTWPVFVVAMGIVGMVSGALDSIGAAFITGLRNVQSAGLIHGSYGIGATVGPLVVAVSPSWRTAVAFGALAASAAALTAARTRSGWPDPAERSSSRGTLAEVPRMATMVSLALFALMVAAEVTAGQWVHTYLTEQRGAGDRSAAVAVAAFWGGLTFGRLALSRRAVSDLLDRIGMIPPVIVATAAFAVLDIVPIGLSGVVLVGGGLALSPVVPWLFATTSDRVGSHHTPTIAGWQLIATNVGAISVPFLVGIGVDARGPRIVLLALFLVGAAGVALLIVERRLPRAA